MDQFLKDLEKVSKKKDKKGSPSKRNIRDGEQELNQV